MNVDDNPEPNEPVEQAEVDGDFEAAEDEAPEAVQAMGDVCNLVFPDLVRIQTSANVNSSQNNINEEYLNGFHNNRGQSRALNPPDVSLLTSNSSRSIDLCSSVDSDSALFSNFSRMNRPINLSVNNNSLIKNRNLIPMTSREIENLNVNSSSCSRFDPGMERLLIKNRMLQDRLIDLERQISVLKSQKTTMPNDNNNNNNNNNNNGFLEESVGQRIEVALTRIEFNLNRTINNLTNRVEQLERKIPKLTGVNEMTNNNDNSCVNNINGNTNGHHINQIQLDQVLQQFKEEQRQQRQETFQLLSVILNQALQEINKYK